MVLELASFGALPAGQAPADDPPLVERPLAWPAFAPADGTPVLFRLVRSRARQAPGLLTVLPGGEARVVAPPTVRVLPGWGELVELAFAYAEGTRGDGREGQRLRARVVRLEVDRAGVVLRLGRGCGADAERWDRLVVGPAR